MERIWRFVGLKVLRQQPRRSGLRFNDGSCIRYEQSLKSGRGPDSRAFRWPFAKHHCQEVAHFPMPFDWMPQR